MIRSGLIVIGLFGSFASLIILLKITSDQRQLKVISNTRKAAFENIKRHQPVYRWLESSFAVSQDQVWGQNPSILDGYGAGQGCSNRTYLIYRCRHNCGGQGDRERGIVTSFLLAVLTNRSFIIDIDSPCPIENHLLSNEYDWLTCKQYALNRTLNNAGVEYVPDRNKLFQNFGTQPSGDFWKKDVVAAEIYWYGIDFVRKHVEMRKMPKLVWIINTTDDYVVHVVLRTLFRPGSRLLDALHAFHTENVGTKQLVCSHIRIGKNPSIPTDDDFTHIRGHPNVSHILSFLKRYTNNGSYAVYVATDSEEVRNRSRLELQNFISLGRKIVHVDRLGGLDKHVGCDGAYSTLEEQFLLSGCDILLVTNSNFGVIAAILSDTVKEVYAYSTRSNTILRVKQWNLLGFYQFTYEMVSNKYSIPRTKVTATYAR